MINFVQTKNFKKLEDFYADIMVGSNIICGGNGKGKSTVFNAIRFCLYGATAVGCSRDLIPTRGTNNCVVTVGLDDLVIRRDMKNCTITRGGTVVAEGNTPCTRFIEDYLGMDFKAFNIFCLSPQGETQALLTIGATELNRRVEKYSGITLIDNMLKAISTDISQLNGKLEGKEIICTNDLRARIAESKEYLHELQATLITTTENAANFKFEAEELHVYLDQVSKDNQQIRISQEAHSVAKAEREEVETELAIAEQDLSENNASSNDVDEVNTAISQIDAQILTIKQRVRRSELLQDDIAKSEKSIARLQGLADVEAEATLKLDHLQAEIAVINKGREDYMAKAMKLKQAIHNDEALIRNGVCPECHRPFDGFNREEVEERLDKNNHDLQEVESLISSCEYDLTAHKRSEKTIMRDIRGYADELANERNRLSSLLEDYGELPTIVPDELDTLQGKRDLLIEERQKIAGKIEAAEQLQKTVENLQRKYDRLSSKMADHADYAFRKVVDLTDKRKRYDFVRAKYEDLNKTERDLASKKVGHESDLEHMVDELENITIQNIEVNSNFIELGLIKDLSKLLRTKRQDCMRDIWDAILIHASNFVMSTTGGWITEIGRDSKGNFTFSEEGRPHCPVEGVASGAQAAFCGTAIRVGMAQALHGKNSLVLMDEPTESMSEDNALKLSSGLMSLGGQTILITHKKSESVSAQQIIEIN